MDLSSVPSWVWWIAGAVAALLLAASAYFGGRLAYRRLSRRYLVQVIGRREGVLASRRTLEAVVRHLADEDEEKRERFASNPEDEDRKALDEVAQRMEIATEELDTMPLPRSLWPAAMALADAAYVIGQEAARVGEAAEETDAVTLLAGVDVTRAAAVFDAADAQVKEASEQFELDEAAVYGGGLYI
ncbi:MAG: hypothetical protein RQ731_01020 [Anaerosomatales bacterium]|nr:hypothetical protein [Anaerosomatales bacterium]MDT8433335.1 hypothetical protein [Anaerosomatales bacterium]